ncbi:predicted protein [Coccidioides posadasii str. Silveira]|uniref:Predicted protein n=2 Tax=Coccidioides posadasii TaxID=199306 RepID=E9D5F5_COCPS|nr:predicted protein [Coccidioides posadasii str. Silveira]KMM66458.1 hypothetical protein CPAG_02797 [Coccidioides posadasii RMSCC 3488]
MRLKTHMWPTKLNSLSLLLGLELHVYAELASSRVSAPISVTWFQSRFSRNFDVIERLFSVPMLIGSGTQQFRGTTRLRSLKRQAVIGPRVSIGMKDGKSKRRLSMTFVRLCLRDGFSRCCKSQPRHQSFWPLIAAKSCHPTFLLVPTPANHPGEGSECTSSLTTPRQGQGYVGDYVEKGVDQSDRSWQIVKPTAPFSSAATYQAPGEHRPNKEPPENPDEPLVQRPRAW